MTILGLKHERPVLLAALPTLRNGPAASDSGTGYGGGMVDRDDWTPGDV
jgi:hypothetical protein